MTSEAEIAPVKDSSSDSVVGRWILPVYILISIASLAPYWLLRYPEIVDFPKHWARFYVECHIAERPVAQMYGLALAVIPNLATDLINLVLCGFIDPKFVLLGSMGVAQIILCLSIALMQQAIWGRMQAFAALIPALGLNLVSAMGYANYQLGMALAFLLFALSLSIGRRSKPQYLLLCNLLGSLIFLSHLFALILSIVFVFFFVAQNWFRQWEWIRRIAAAGVATAAGFALPGLGLIVMEGAGSSSRLDYIDKLRSLAAPFTSLFPPADALIAVAVVVLLFIAWRRRKIVVAAPLRWPLAGLLALCILLPAQISSAIDVDARIALAVFFLFLAGLGLRPGNERMQRGVLATAGAIMLLRLVSMGFEWTRFDRDVDELRGAFSVLQPGSRILTVFADGARWNCGSIARSSLPYWHLASLAMIDRQAFSALSSTGEGMQPIFLGAAYEEVAAGTDATPLAASAAVQAATMSPHDASPAAQALRGSLEAQGKSPYFLGWPAKFDWVVYFHFGCAADFAPPVLEKARAGSFFTIFAVRHRG
jgi:hypothetical protein